ncbi:AMP-binding protein [Nocardia sp. NBC_00508]|uniref:AMP-binding protein n=1 Tax=Nocardia sp. NBC_00508 TaxID=2975992 RepID=UPI002E820B8C|nr:AMP-binding protein [Nocardia sp. NBC_00508]WUD66732.1 AMP-binding protein [Nocardia sp. NBC_00508]
MVAEIVEVVHELPLARQVVWNILIQPENYARLFSGVGGMEQLEQDESYWRAAFRAGSPAIGIETVEVRLTVHQWYERLELSAPNVGALAAIRLKREFSGYHQVERTRVRVTYFAAARVHPSLTRVSKAAVLAWTRTGLRRVLEFAQQAPKSVLINGENLPIRRRAGVVGQMIRTGVLAPSRPDRGVRQLAELAKWRFTLPGGYAAGAALDPDRPAIIDDRGSRTFAELHRRTNALATAMADLGIDAHQAIGVLAHNHADMVETMVAAGKLGADMVLLNAGLSGGQLEEIAQRERLAALFVDAELEPLVQYLHDGIPRYITAIRGSQPDRSTIDDLIALGRTKVPRPAHPGRLLVLTSGTSGAPKCARRPHAKGFGTIAALLSRIPLRMHETMLIPAPLFHTWGLAALQLSTALRATVVLPEQFDAEDCLRLIAEHRVTSLIVVPTMVHRILCLPPAVRARYDTSSLRVVASCGAPLPTATVLRFLDSFGDVLYNVYGSTEVSWATIADPEDLRISPTTAGRPPLGTKVAVLGPDGRPVPKGAVGRIFVGNHMLFDGYVNSIPPAEADGMLDTGDLGYVDVAGRLFIAGRDDEMIISGGENVFPRPVEEALSFLPHVTDVAVVGVPDPEFGQRLAAFVVKSHDSGLDSAMVRNYIRSRLGRIAVPRDVAFVTELPRGASGKIVKRLLAIEQTV